MYPHQARCVLERHETSADLGLLMPKRVKKTIEGRGYWAFAADPSRYKILDAIVNLPIDWWRTDDKPIRLGDHAIIWQLSDRHRRRGIIALAEIGAGPERRSDFGNPYWVDQADAEKGRYACWGSLHTLE